MNADTEFMARALALARRGWYSTPPNPRVGCVLVKNDVILGEGWHETTGGPHAEIVALRDAASRGSVQGATVYVTLEPCCHPGRTPPCVDALVEAGIACVVVGMLDLNPRVAGNGVQRLRAAGIEVKVGVLENDCAALNPGFFSRMLRHRPRVRAKLAMSVDGRSAGGDGESRWITGPAAREDVHRLRAESGAVLVGSATVRADNPRLDVRLPGVWRQPLRVVLDTHLRLPPAAALLTDGGPSLVLTTEAGGAAWDAIAATGAALRRIAPAPGGLDLPLAMAELTENEINDVLVEAGATLTGALLQAGLVDELIVYMAPTLIGHTGRALAMLPGVARFAERMALEITDVRAVGSDWRITARIS